MIRGGYKIIDLKNKELTVDVGMVYEGIYESIESTNKPILLSGLNIGGKEYPDFWAFPEIYESNYYFILTSSSGDTTKITIEDTDVVTVELL